MRLLGKGLGWSNDTDREHLCIINTSVRCISFTGNMKTIDRNNMQILRTERWPSIRIALHKAWDIANRSFPIDHCRVGIDTRDNDTEHRSDTKGCI